MDVVQAPDRVVVVLVTVVCRWLYQGEVSGC